MNGLVRLLLAAFRISPWLGGLVVIQMKGSHIATQISNAKVPKPVEDAIRALLSDGLQWGDIGHAGLLITVAGISSLVFFAFHNVLMTLYDLWILREIQEAWKRRPWRKKVATRKHVNLPKNINDN